VRESLWVPATSTSTILQHYMCKVLSVIRPIKTKGFDERIGSLLGLYIVLVLLQLLNSTTSVSRA